MALQTADPSCPDDSGNIYVDCDNGTVTDNRSGLVWLKNADCVGHFVWQDAMQIVASLSDLPDAEICGSLEPDECDCGLSDGSSPGEWRLPSIAEWKAMVAWAVAQGCEDPALTDDAGTTCMGIPCFIFETCSFYGAWSGSYWSSSSYVSDPSQAWNMHLKFGYVLNDPKYGPFHVWPVRGGQ